YLRHRTWPQYVEPQDDRASRKAQGACPGALALLVSVEAAAWAEAVRPARGLGIFDRPPGLSTGRSPAACELSTGTSCTLSTKAVLPPPAVSSPWKLIVCAPAATVKIVVV